MAVRESRYAHKSTSLFIAASYIFDHMRWTTRCIDLNDRQYESFSKDSLSRYCDPRCTFILGIKNLARTELVMHTSIALFGPISSPCSCCCTDNVAYSTALLRLLRDGQWMVGGLYYMRYLLLLLHFALTFSGLFSATPFMQRSIQSVCRRTTSTDRPTSRSVKICWAAVLKNTYTYKLKLVLKLPILAVWLAMNPTKFYYT